MYRAPTGKKRPGARSRRGRDKFYRAPRGAKKFKKGTMYRAPTKSKIAKRGESACEFACLKRRNLIGDQSDCEERTTRNQGRISLRFARRNAGVFSEKLTRNGLF